MTIELVPVVTIFDKVLATAFFAFIVRGYNFCDAHKSGGGLGHAVAQVNQQITVNRWHRIAADGYRRHWFAGCMIQDLVRYETAIAEGPQQFIKSRCTLLIRYLNVNGVIQSIGFFSQAAGKTLSVYFSACL